MQRTELIVALDYDRIADAERLMERLGNLPVLYKVGLQLFIAAGPSWVRQLVESRRRIFLDLKLHDIPNTVAKAAVEVAKLRCELFTVHLTGGPVMIEAIKKELAAFPAPPRMLGVTVLTSFNDADWGEVSEAVAQQKSTPQSSVTRLAQKAIQWGAGGIVCSPMELQSVRKISPSLFTVVPGIRPQGSASNDQSRVMTPREAAQAGANAIVVGRPITESDNPLDTTKKILEEIK